MAHRQRGIGLVIKRAGDHGDRLSRNEFADKGDSAPPVIDILSTHIKTQIHFLEIAMPWNRQTEDARVEKEESDDTQEGSPFVKIELCPVREQRLQEFRVGGEIQHRQVTPIRSEKWF